ncbi:rubredoxin [Gallaecimonas pentaromativorans]|uniref:Rubredoxin n=1 Tax=Gallaecimonas pentaromativorans TaxID=584787 RepID=A0A3N1PT02_9GAMM|nr:rubredoxin [Gallaecimonas pentaromativorans]MED5523763.1 rubredoxin [Pseudomonadota bacterium]ROQ27666.1 rubredoxin [Gallaecimonas pentaromativorans]
MKPYRKFKCSLCEHIYDEERGDPDTGIAPGTRWEDVPDDWFCPDCGAPKAAFDEI